MARLRFWSFEEGGVTSLLPLLPGQQLLPAAVLIRLKIIIIW